MMRWPSFVATFDADIAPIYHAHERDFDEPGIHGRMHIARCLLFAEFMGRHYHARTAARPAMNDVRFATAFHDAARRANGPDLWDEESAGRCAEYARRHPALFSRDGDAMAALLAAKPDPGGFLEAQIVHDADVLDIMRPCCGHGGREGFREGALIFLGEHDPAGRDPEVRSRLVEEAWALIRATEECKSDLAGSGDYLAEILAILAALHSECPMLAGELGLRGLDSP